VSSSDSSVAAPAAAELELLAWRRDTFALYGRVREAAEPQAAWAEWRAGRDRMFRAHPQTPLDPADVPGFAGLEYHDYDPAYRVTATVEPGPAQELELASSTGQPITFRRFADARFELDGQPLALPLYWLEGYGGGVFLPFADATSGRSTFGGGRYLLDSVKGADLGTRDGGLVLDFNFAYNPSCAYAPVWTCPLPPAASRLPVAVTAGELAPTHLRH
jgi:uncharacterized protein